MRWIRGRLNVLFGRFLEKSEWESAKNAIPFLDYHRDWSDSWHGVYRYRSGYFGVSQMLWRTSTPDWDADWFRRHGIRPPKYMVEHT